MFYFSVLNIKKLLAFKNKKKIIEEKLHIYIQSRRVIKNSSINYHWYDNGDIYSSTYIQCERSYVCGESGVDWFLLEEFINDVWSDLTREC